MNTALEIHDSQLLSIRNDEKGSLKLLIDAYIHKSAGQPGVDKGTVWRQKINLFFSEVTAIINLTELPSTLSDGYLIINENRWDNVIKIPIEEKGDIVFECIGNNETKLKIKTRSIVSESIGEAEYVE